MIIKTTRKIVSRQSQGDHTEQLMVATTWVLGIPLYTQEKIMRTNRNVSTEALRDAQQS